MDFEELWAGYEHLCPYYDDEDGTIYFSDLESTEYDDGSCCCSGSAEEDLVESGDGDREMEGAEDDDWSESDDGGVSLDPAVRLD